MVDGWICTGRHTWVELSEFDGLAVGCKDG